LFQDPTHDFFNLSWVSYVLEPAVSERDVINRQKMATEQMAVFRLLLDMVWCGDSQFVRMRHRPTTAAADTAAISQQNVRRN
jgi:hypothetical protein